MKALGIVLIVAGGVGFIVFLVASLLSIFGGLQRVECPGARELQLEAGDHTIYWEIRARVAGRGAGTDDLEVAVESSDGPVKVSPAGPFTSRYSTGDRVGVSLFSFSLWRKGRYTVRARPAPGRTLPTGEIAVGRSLGFLGILRVVLTCLAIVAAGVGSGVAILIRASKRPA